MPNNGPKHDDCEDRIKAAVAAAVAERDAEWVRAIWGDNLTFPNPADAKEGLERNKNEAVAAALEVVSAHYPFTFKEARRCDCGWRENPGDPRNVPEQWAKHIRSLATDAQAALERQSDNQVVWFHGTSLENASAIEKDGFKPGTWFSRHMEDALEFGGPCVFWVRVTFDKTPLRWQVCCENALPVSAIERKVCFELALERRDARVRLQELRAHRERQADPRGMRIDERIAELEAELEGQMRKPVDTAVPEK